MFDSMIPGRTLTTFGLRYALHRAYQKVFKLPIRGLRVYLECVTGKRGLEIGGPSPIFARSGLIPIYDHVASLDNCNFAAQTLWADHVSGQSFVYSDQRPAGRQYVAEGMDLLEIADQSYDFILSSHMLEHTANPLRALHAWHRVLKPRARLILILPNPVHTFDHRRPITSLAHLIDDFDGSTDESDSTHIPEILALHDLRRDPGAKSYDAFKARCEANFKHRGMHHHVFDSSLVKSMLQHAKFDIIAIRTAYQNHIIAVGERTD